MLYSPPVEGPVFEFDVPEEKLKEVQRQLRPCTPYYLAAVGKDHSVLHCSRPEKAGTPGYCDGCEYLKWQQHHGK